MRLNFDWFQLPRLVLGQRTLRVPVSSISATEAAVVISKREGVSLAELVARHQSGDWGELTEDEWGANEAALESGGTVMSLYDIKEGVHVWIFTEGDGRTTIALGEDF